MFLLVWVLLVVVPLLLQRKTIRGDLRHSKLLASQLKPRHFLHAFITISLVIVSSYFLVTKVPYMDIGWFSLLRGDSSSAENTEILNGASLVSIISMTFITLVLAFILLMIPHLAFLEEVSFRSSLYGYEAVTGEKPSTLKILRSSLNFGLAHLIMGIPVGVALSLSIGGLVFYLTGRRAMNRTRKYTFKEDDNVNIKNQAYITRHDHSDENNTRHETDLGIIEKKMLHAVTESTLSHTAHNLIIISVLIVSLSVTIITAVFQ